MKIYILNVIANLILVSSSFGCICIRPTIEQSLNNRYLIIFKGKVIFDGIDSAIRDRSGHYSPIQKLEVIESWNESAVNQMEGFQENLVNRAWPKFNARLLKWLTWEKGLYKHRSL
jgi:hypothetical protein